MNFDDFYSGFATGILVLILIMFCLSELFIILPYAEDVTKIIKNNNVYQIEVKIIDSISIEEEKLWNYKI